MYIDSKWLEQFRAILLNVAIFRAAIRSRFWIPFDLLIFYWFLTTETAHLLSPCYAEAAPGVSGLILLQMLTIVVYGAGNILNKNISLDMATCNIIILSAHVAPPTIKNERTLFHIFI